MSEITWILIISTILFIGVIELIFMAFIIRSHSDKLQKQRAVNEALLRSNTMVIDAINEALK